MELVQLETGANSSVTFTKKLFVFDNFIVAAH